MFKGNERDILYQSLCTNTTISIECKRVTDQQSGVLLNNEMAILYWFEGTYNQY